MQFFSSFCLTLSNYLLSGIQSTQLFAKHCLACQIIHSSERLALRLKLKHFKIDTKVKAPPIDPKTDKCKYHPLEPTKTI